MTGASSRGAREPRWPIVLATLAALTLAISLPHYHRVVPAAAAIGYALCVWGAIAAGAFAVNRRLWLRVEQVLVGLCALALIGTVASTLAILLRLILAKDPDSSGLVLLSSSVAIWVNNVIAFALLTWQVDRGGTPARDTGQPGPADWRFAEEAEPRPDGAAWQPRFVDYLFLAFSTSAAFSATDTAVPVTPRAKLLTMLHAALSLTTMVVVASRAINVLGD